MTNGVEIRSQTRDFKDRFYLKLKEELGSSMKLVGPSLGSRHISNLNIEFEVSSSNLLGRIAPKVSASNGSACSSGHNIEESHVLRAIGLTLAQAERCIRFSFGIGLSDVEIDSAALTLIYALKN